MLKSKAESVGERLLKHMGKGAPWKLNVWFSNEDGGWHCAVESNWWRIRPITNNNAITQYVATLKTKDASFHEGKRWDGHGTTLGMAMQKAIRFLSEELENTLESARIGEKEYHSTTAAIAKFSAE